MIICINFTIVGFFLSFAINANNHFSFTLSFFYSRIEKIMNTYSTIRFTEEYMKEKIIKVRTFLLRHFKNQYLQTLIMGLISYEMLSYMFFGLGTCIVDYGVFSSITAMGLDELISNIISTLCAILFAYVTNKLWVFKSKTHGFVEVFGEFLRFANVRIFTLVMTEAILIVSKLFHGNPYIAKAVAMVLTVILNYVFSKLFIFNKRKETNNEYKEK